MTDGSTGHGREVRAPSPSPRGFEIRTSHGLTLRARSQWGGSRIPKRSRQAWGGAEAGLPARLLPVDGKGKK